MDQNAPILEGVTEKVQSSLHHRRKVNPIRQAVENTIRAMVQQGSSVRKIAAALNISPNTVQLVRNDMKALLPEEDRKSGLLSPLRDENAGKLIDHFIGKGLKMKTIKGSDALGAVKMYADRRWPAQQAAPPGPRISFVQINVDVARADLHLGAHPTPTGGVLEDGKTIEGQIINEINPCNVP